MSENTAFENQKSYAFLRANYGLIRLLLKVVFWVMTGVVCFLIYFIFLQKPPLFYAYSGGQIDTSAQLFGLQQPQIKNDAMMRWASQAVSEILTFSVLNVDAHMQEVQRYFTIDGYAQFMRAMNDSGLLASVVSDNLRYSTNSCDVIDIVNERTVTTDGQQKHIWSLDIPVVLSVEAAGGLRVARYLVRATVAGGQQQVDGGSIALTGIMMEASSGGVCQAF
jgi:hypothetical protein